MHIISAKDKERIKKPIHIFRQQTGIPNIDVEFFV